MIVGMPNLKRRPKSGKFLCNICFAIWITGFNKRLYFMTGKGIPRRLVLGNSKMILGLLEGIPTMLKGEVSMVLYFTF